MQTSLRGYAHLHDFESCRLVAYPDPKTGGKPWTIGWGHTGPEVVPGLVWTQEKADEVFLSDLTYFEKVVTNAVTVPLSQGQFDAMVSIVFNVGEGNSRKSGIIRLKNGKPSTLLRKLNAGDYAGASLEFLKWISPGSTVEAGLLRRRKAERRMFDASPN